MNRPIMYAPLRSIRASLPVGLVAFALLIGGKAMAQLAVTSQSDLQQLAGAITGPGVQILNPTITCHALGFGEYDYTGTLTSLDEGVILTSGRITDAIGPNNVENTTFQANTNGDAILNTVTGRTTRDACRLEFDIIPSGDSLSFDFTFASEEYNEWVGSQFNDVFGFFISGAGITGDPGIGSDKNIALIPGTVQAVTINNVNNGSNAAYYFNNAGGPDIQYDGYTLGLKAVSVVQPCQTYHLKLIVADASDRKFDSGVFIERIKSNQVVMTSHTLSGDPDMVEGCNPGWVTFTRPAPRPQPLNLVYYLQGTATNGTDYSAIGNVSPAVAKTVTIPANQTSVNVNVVPLSDVLDESTEYLRFILGNPYCPAQQLDTLIFNIVDTMVANVTPANTTICSGGSVQFQVTGGASYAWSPATGLSCTTCANPIATPTVTRNYTVVVTDGTCTRTVTRQIRVSNPVLSSVVTAPLCNGQSNGAVSLSVSGSIAPYTYAWTGPNGFTANTEDLVNIAAGTYTLNFTDAAGCSRSQSFNVGSPGALSAALTPSILPFGENITCFGASTGTINANITGGTGPYATAWTGPNGFTANTQNLTSLAAGPYTANITDANGCTFSTGYTLTQPGALAPTTGSITNVSCFGTNIGTATASIVGGVPPYSYSWNSAPAQSTATATGLPSGSYTATVTDGYGCTRTANATITGPAQTLSTSVSGTINVSCFGGTSGGTTVNASGGTSPYSFSWNTSPVQSIATATNLTAGTWTCTVTDANGCSTTRTVTITQPVAPLSSSLSAQTNVGCFGATTGSATAAAAGGTAPYAYSWNTSPAQTGATANTLIAGTWTCTITDARGCTTTQSAIILQPSVGLSSIISAQTNVGCFGAATGSATVTGLGGTAPYSYSWNTTPVQTGATANNLSAGVRMCTTTDANGCSTTRSVTITQPTAALSSSVSAQTNIGCFGTATGAVAVTASGGTSPYSFIWNTTPVQNTASALNLPAGVWTCTITDASGCSTTRNVNITQPAVALGSSVGAQTNVGCFGGSTGSASVTGTGGISPYSYDWNTTPVQNSATANNLAAGTWTCNITDANGCSTTRNITITQPSVALSSSISAQTNVGCFGANTGSVTAAAANGTAPYSYTWNTTPPQSGATANNLAAGTWSCTINDANGCPAIRNVTIAQPAAALSSSISSQTNVGCFGANTGSATVVAANGTAPYSFTWNTTPAQSGATASNLAAGTWTCTITDASGCLTTRNVTITQPTAALSSSTSSQTNVGCFGAGTGSATVAATNGTAPYSFSWNTVPAQNSATASNLAAGTWTCTMTDANGCTTSRNVTIAQPTAALGSAITSQTNVGCSGATTGSATVSGSGGTTPYTFSWNTTPLQTSTTASNLASGTWTCTITDASGCTTTQTVSITQPAAGLTSNVVVQTNAGCFGGATGSATVSAAGGTSPYSYSWNTLPVQTSATAINLSAGTRICTITDANGCTTTQSVTITQPAAAIGISVTAQTNVGCFGAAAGSAAVSATGGTSPYSFSWNTTPVQSTASATNLPAGTWTCTITDANGCAATRNVSITQPTSILGSLLSVQTNVGCFGAATGAATVNGLGGTAPYAFNWNTAPAQNNATANNLAVGTWTCTITDANGCSTTRSVTITQPGAALSSSSGTQTNVGCFGSNSGSATVTIAGGTAPYSYSWNTTPVQTSGTAINLSAGTWICTITDANGCSAAQSVTITQPAAALSSSVITQSNVGCFGTTNGSATVSAANGTAAYSYSWNTVPVQSTATASNLTAGAWTCTIIDANGCTATRVATITQPAAALSSSIGAQANVGCFGGTTGSATVSISGGTVPYTYNWNTTPAQTSASATNLAAGNWTCTITDANGCTTTRNVTITQPAAALTSSISAQSNVGCFGAASGSATVAVSGGSTLYAYLWNTAPVQTSAAANNLIAGTWTCTITDANGCSTTQTASITQPSDALTNSISAQTNVGCFAAATGSASLAASGGTAPYAYNWNTTPAQTSASATNLTAGNWTCTITDANACSTTRTVTITQPAAALALNGVVTPATCGGAANGAVDATISGGTAPYPTSWTGPNGFNSNAVDITALGSGVYTITVSDAHGCSASQSFNVGQPGLFAISGNTSNYNGFGVSCPAATDGTIAQTVTGGTTPYTHLWNGPNGFSAATDDITAITAGSYTYVVTDANGCSTSASYTLNAPAPLSAVLSAPVVNGAWNVGCNGANTGSINASVSGGVSPISTAWTGPSGFAAATEDIASLIAGTYDLVITDANGCSANAASTLSQPTALSGSGTQVTAVDCFGNSTGVAQMAAADGTAPYTYSWNTVPVQTSATAINLSAGNWTCTITDANACSTTRTVTITQPAAALALNGVVTPATCGGAANGAVDATISGGTAPYPTSWTGPNGFNSNAVDITALGSGVYTITVSDAHGCSASQSFNVGQPGLFAISGNTSNYNGFGVSCPAATDGTIAQTVTGGTTPYTHLWNGPNGFSAATDDITAITAGSYTYVVTDANGCSTSASYTLNAPAPLSAVLSAPVVNGAWNVGCNGANTGSINASVSGGVSPISTAWTGPSGFAAATEDIASLIAGTYDLVITDANGCSANAASTLSQPTALSGSGTQVTAVDCFGNSTGVAQMAAADGTAPYTYSWNTVPVQTSATAINLSAGNWTCTITDANACSTTRTVTITQPAAALAVSVTGSTDVLCFGAPEGAATAVGTDGTAPYTFIWDSAPAQLAANANGLFAGSYSVTATDANGCAATDVVSINGPSSEVDAFFDQVVPVSCFGANDGSASITLSGGSGSYTISWDTQPVINGPTASGLAPGLYTVTATDDNGCSLIKHYPVMIIGPTSAISIATDLADISCFGAQNGSIDLTLSGGQAPYTRIWTDVNGLTSADEDLVNLDAGPYALHVVDGFGCVKDTIVMIQEPSAIAITGSITTAACQGSSTGAVDAEVNGGTAPYSYAWSGPNGSTSNAQDVTGLSAGVYNVDVTDAQGCTQTANFNVSQPGSLQVSVTPSSFSGGWGVSCAASSDGAIDLDANGGTLPYTFQWNGPNGFAAAIEDINTIASGTYTAIVTDANGCAVTISTTLSAPAILGSTISTSVFGGNNISCAGLSDGSVDAFIFGGTAPYDLAWTGPNAFTSDQEDPIGLVAGAYDVSITDANGCASTASVTLTEPQALSNTTLTSITTSGHEISCSGALTGSIQLTLNGGTQPYVIQWNGPNGFSANSATITDLIAGSYTANSTDANGCTYSTTLVLTEPTPLTAIGILADFNGNNVSCDGSSDGSIDLTTSGGAGGYSFSWNGPNGFGSTDEDPSGLTAGDYSVLITDLNGCSTTADLTLSAPAALDPIVLAADFNGSNTSCSGIADGSIDLAVGGGTAPFNYAWNGPNGLIANSEDIAALEAGDYAVDVTDANGCNANANITLIASPVLSIGVQAVTLPGGNHISCSGVSDGAIDLTIGGGTAPYTIAWTDGVGFNSNSEDISGIGAGFYQATVTDVNGCSQTASTLLTAPTPLDVTAVLSSVNGNNVTCNGATDGSIDLTVNGSVGPYTILWSTGSTDEDLVAITSGTYEVTVTDLNGCSLSNSYTLTAPATVLIDLTSALQPGGNNILCAGGTDGNIDAAISGGTTPYDITWSGPNGFTTNSTSITALSAGTYDLVVTDANGCSQTSSTTLTEPALVAVTLSSTTYNGGFNIPCSEVTIGVFDASVSGGTPSYTYAWSGPNGFTSTDADLLSLVAGDYNLTVTDSNGCTGGASASLTQPGPLDVVIQLTDFGGVPISCAGSDGGISLAISGGTPAYNFDWTGPNGFGSQQEDLNGLSAGDYALTVRDANGCFTDTTITLTAPEQLHATFAGTSNLCADQSAGSIELTTTGGGAPYTFAWTGPNGFSSTDEDLSGLVNGTYSVTVSDGLGCGNTFSSDLIGPAQITSGTYVSYYGLYNLQCQGDSSGVIELTPQGGSTPFSLLINGPDGYTSNELLNQHLVAGDYMITITDLSGCQLDTTITLTQPNTSVDANLTLSVYPSGTNVSCYGASDGSIDATVSGGTGPYVFNWRGPDSLEFATEDVTGLPAGNYNYELVVTDANQCNFFTTVTLTQPDTALYASSILTTYAGGFNTTCETANDGAIDLTANGGNGSYLYQWFGPNGFTSANEDISSVVGGTYTVDITDVNGCTLQHVLDVVAPQPIAPVLNVFTFPGGSMISCNGLADGSISSTISGGAAPAMYTWTGPNGFTASSADISGLAAGTYCLNVTDANGCTAQQCLDVFAPAQLGASATAVAADCGTTNGSADLTVSGGSAPFVYAWDNGISTEDLSNVAPGTFNVTVTDANGCTASTVAVVNGSSGVNVDAQLNTVVCYGTSEGSIDLTVSNGTLPYAFNWSNGLSSEDLTDVAAGAYSVTITDGSGCVFTDSYMIAQNTAIAIDTVITTYQGGYNVSAYGVSDGSITTAVSGGVAPYVFDWSNGATSESVSGIPAGTYTLLVTDANGCTASLEVTLTQSTEVEMPNGFSPNSDGSNDTFVIHGIEGYPKNLLTVLNRWGNVVYEQPNYKNEWAGDNSQGAQLPNGTYFIILSLNEGTRTLQGFVDLRR